MNDDFNDYLRRNFSGDIPDAVADDNGPPVLGEPRLRTMRSIRSVEPPSATASATATKFQQLMTRLPSAPLTPSVPPRSKRYLLENKENAQRWLDEAESVESDLKLGQSVSHEQVTRLVLDAIPVVEQLVEKSP